MPKLYQVIEVTDEFNSLDINILNIQEASRFLLKCMKDIPKNENLFSYGSLITFMIHNCTNRDYYSGNNLLKHNNIKLYWNYSNSNKHSASISRFNNYYNFV